MDSDFEYFFEYRIKAKILSRIKPPLMTVKKVHEKIIQ